MKRTITTTIVILTITLLLFTACKDRDDETEMGDFINIVDETTKIKVVELKLDGNIFQPDTIEVEQGQKVVINFMNEEVYAFSLPEYGITENAGINNYVEFIADQQGVFIFECADCEDVITGILKVN